MLIEIHCDRFRQKTISFQKGLNVVLGDENATNSIGKSTLLMVIDFVLGGDSLLDHNSDVVDELGHHDYQFAFKFGNEMYYFRRGTADHALVLTCDSSYHVIDSQSVEQFRSFLKAGFDIGLEDISFRSLISPYIRVWGKGNVEDAYHPLHAFKAQAPRDCINNLIKTFDLFHSIKEIQVSLSTKERESSALRVAMDSNILPKVGKREHAKNLTTIENLEHQLDEIKSNLALYATSIADIVNREMVQQKQARDELLNIRSRLDASLLRVRRNITNNRHIKSSHFDGLKHYFPEIDEDRLAQVEEFHSEVARLLKTELTESERSLSDRLAQVDLQLSEIDSTISHALKSVDEPTAILDKVVSLSNSISSAKQQNRFYELNIALKESIATLRAALTVEKMRALESIEESINNGMRATTDAIFGQDRKSPRLTLRESSYSFEVFEDTGTGAAFVALIVFDLTMFADTSIPVIAHDSLIFKNIENDSVSKLVKAYAQLEKQSFIAIDEVDKYGEEAAMILRSKRVVSLSDRNVLYDTDWRAKDARKYDGAA